MKEETHMNQNEKASDGVIQENEFLKDYVIRLSKELQRKSQSHSSNYKHLGPTENLSSDTVDGKVCIPLFQAYDSRIEELCIFLDQQGSALDSLTALVKNLSEENQLLRSSSSGSTKLVDTKVLEKVTNNCDNEILEKQAELLVVELEHANHTISLRDECVAELSKEISLKLDCIQSLTKRNKDLSNEKNMVERKLLDVIEELGLSKKQVNDLETKLKTLHEVQVNMESKAIIAVETESDIKKKNESLNDKLVNFSLTVQNIQNQLCDSTKSYEKLNLEYMEQSKILADARNSINVLKQQVNEKDVRLRFAEESQTRVTKKLAESSALVEALILQKDQLSTKVQALENELNEVLESKKTTSNICSIYETVQELHDKHQKTVEAQESLIDSLKIQMAKMEFDLGMRNKSLNEANLKNQELEKQILTERMSRSDLSVVSQSLKASHEKFEAQSLKLKSALTEIGSLKSNVSSLQDALDAMKSDYTRLQQESGQAQSRFQAERTEQQVLLEELKMKSQAERVTFQEEREDNHETVRRLNVTYQTEISAAHERIKQQDQTFKENQETIDKCQKELLSLSQKFQDEKAKIIQVGESNISELNRVHHENMKRLAAHQSSNVSLRKEKKELTEYLQGAIVCNKNLESTKKDLEMRLSMMGNQLSNCLGQHKTRLEKERGLRLELQSLKQEVQFKKQ